SRRASGASDASVGCSMMSAMAQHLDGAAALNKGWALAKDISCASVRWSIADPPAGGVSTDRGNCGLERGSRASQAAEARERVLRRDLVDELAARLDLAVEPLRQLFRLLARAGADDQVVEGPHDAEALLFELLLELSRLAVRRRLHANLPGRVPPCEQVV